LPACSAVMFFLLLKKTWFYNWEIFLLFFSSIFSDSEVESEIRSFILFCLSNIISTSEFWQICISISDKSIGIIINKSDYLRYLFLYNVRFFKIDFIFRIFIILIIFIIFLALKIDNIFSFLLCNIYSKSLLNLIFLKTIIYLNWDI